MPHETTVDKYLKNVLRPQLDLCGLSASQQAILLLDVRTRLRSLAAHWHDVPFRQTVLLLGHEEAIFYEPASAVLNVRSLVNVAIRNSLLEDLAASKASVPELASAKPVLTDAGMGVLTKSAIEFFQTVGLEQMDATGSALPAPDIFGDLAKSFPRAWCSLSQLANSSAPEVFYVLPSAARPRLPSSAPLTGKPKTEIAVVLSGMDPTFDPGLLAFLRLIEDGTVPFFFSDSFKAITRHPAKLCHILEFVLSHGAALVTHNYFLGPTSASRREPLLRPFHYSHEAKTKLVDQSGLTGQHRQALAWIKARL
jgi:hypothetical protein